MKNLKRLILVASSALVTVVAAPSSWASTDTWNGSGNDWNTAANWTTPPSTHAVPTAADTAQFDGTGNGQSSVSLSAPGTALNLTFTSGAGAYTLAGSGLTLASTGTVLTDSLITGAENINNAVTLGGSYTFNSGSTTAADTLSFGGNITGPGSAGTLTLTGANTGTNTLDGVIANGAGALALTKGGAGEWVLSGNNTYTGATTLQGGTLVLDYTTNTGNKLGGGTSVLTLGGVNLQLTGGSGTETVASTIFGGGSIAGQTNISRTSGTETLALGALAFNNTAQSGPAVSVNFQSGVATTSNTRSGTGGGGIFGGYTTVGSQGAASWATSGPSGTNAIVAYTLDTVLPNTAGTSLNYVVNDSFTPSTGGGTMNALKITTDGSAGSTPTLTLNTNTTFAANGGILNSAASNSPYLINGTGVLTLASGGGFSIQQYGNGTLEIDNQIVSVQSTLNGSGFYIQKAGPGTLILKGANAWKDPLSINQGILSVSNDSNLGGVTGSIAVASSSTASTTVTLASTAPVTLVVGSSFLGSTVTQVTGTTVTLAGNANANLTNGSATYGIASAIFLSGGTLEATGSFSLSESGAASPNRAISIGANGGTIQVDGSNTLTAPGVIANISPSSIGALTKTGTGTLVLSGASTFTGGVNINGGVVNLGAAQNSTTGPLGGGTGAQPTGLVSFGGGTLQYSSVNTTDYSSKFSSAANQAYSIDTNGQTVAFASGLNSSGGSLTKIGAGALTLSATNVYSGPTTIQGGTLKLATSGNNNIANSNIIVGDTVANNGAVLDISSVSGSGGFKVAKNLSGTGTVTTAGTVGIAMQSGSVLAPGSSQSVPFAGTPGTTANGDLTVSTTGFTGGSSITTPLVSVAASANLTTPALTFALGAGNTSSKIVIGGLAANVFEFNLGGTTSTSSVVSINDLVGAQLTLNGFYTLIQGNGSTIYDNAATGTALTVGSNGQILDGLSLLAPDTADNSYSQLYASSQLFLVGDNIEVEVVPEPSTWAMMLGGLSVLLFWQRRRQC